MVLLGVDEILFGFSLLCDFSFFCRLCVMVPDLYQGGFHLFWRHVVHKPSAKNGYFSLPFTVPYKRWLHISLYLVCVCIVCYGADRGVDQSAKTNVTFCLAA